MSTQIRPAAAAAIGEFVTAWNQYAASTLTLAGPLPDSSRLLAARGLLREQMPDFDAATGLLPWEVDPDVDPQAPDGPPWVGAAFEVLYELFVLGRGPGRVDSYAYHLVELGNRVGDLASWHPDYDEERGVIAAVG